MQVARDAMPVMHIIHHRLKKDRDPRRGSSPFFPVAWYFCQQGRAEDRAP